jgi:hypothetical protein
MIDRGRFGPVAVDLGVEPWRAARRAPHEVFVRRRLAAALLASLVLLGLGLGVRSVSGRSGGVPASAVGSAPASTRGAAAPDAPLIYVVQPGDTMWGIATAFAADNIADFADRLAEINGGATIDVGQVLVLPG